MKKVKEIPTPQEELAEKIEMGEQKKDMVLNRISIESALEKLPDELKEVERAVRSSWNYGEIFIMLHF